MSEAHGTRPVHQLPEPARFWIAYAPRSWRAAEKPWSDLARCQLEGLRPRGEPTLPHLEARALEEVLYLPPVAEVLRRARDGQAAELVESGTAIVLQLRPGETPPPMPVTVVYDLLDPLLEGELELLAQLPAGSAAVWPLLPGISDRAELWIEGCELLQAAGVRTVQPVALELNARARRLLAEERDDEVFDALFHGGSPSERAFSRVAHQHGLKPFLERPEAPASRRRSSNRRLAGQLALAGELWLRLGRRVSTGHSFFRAARGAESTHHDLAALVREENLAVLDWLGAAGIELVIEVVTTGSSSLLAELLEDYLVRDGPPPREETEEAEADDEDEED